MKKYLYFLLFLFSMVIFAGCAVPSFVPTKSKGLSVLASDSILADITQNIAGDRIKIQTFLPDGIDSHSYQPSPQDVAQIIKSDLFITNGGGYEGWMSQVIESNPGSIKVVEASKGLEFRQPNIGNTQIDEQHQEEGDPHFWTDPNNVIRYAENIRDALVALDPAGKTTFDQNTKIYINKLQELDRWIIKELASVSANNRVIITNHETLGYFADRYGFTIIGTFLEGSSSESSVSSQHVSELVRLIKQNNIKVAFIEQTDNSSLADQIHQETGIEIINNLNTHSLIIERKTTTYIEVMRHNVSLLTQLK